MKVLDAAFIAPAPEIFLSVALAKALKFFWCGRRFERVNTLDSPARIMSGVVDEINIRQELARSQGWDLHSPTSSRPQLIPTAQQRAGAHRGQYRQQARPWPHRR